MRATQEPRERLDTHHNKASAPTAQLSRPSGGAFLETHVNIAKLTPFKKPPAANNTFSPRHIDYLTARAVDPMLAAAAGLRTVSAEEGATLLGFDRPLRSPGLLVPYPNVPGYVRVRVDEDGGYLVPTGREVPIYVPDICRVEGDEALLVVEGPVKALALSDHGFNVVGLGGVATTLRNKAHELNDSWDIIKLTTREVVVVFDANRASNPAVAQAEARLAVALEQRGARVRVAALPLRADGSDQGPDDFLAAHGDKPLEAIIAAAAPADPVERVRQVQSNQQALDLLQDQPFLAAVVARGAIVQEKVSVQLRQHGVKETVLPRALKELARTLKEAASTRQQAEADSPVYAVIDGIHCRMTAARDGTPLADPISNFAAQIVEERRVDDGSGRPERGFVLEGTLWDGTPLPRISVSVQELRSDTWPMEQWGARVMTSASMPRSGHHLLNAIKLNSTPIDTVAYAHTGFRRRDDEWIFLHGGGAVGADDVTVELDQTAARFVLPDGPCDMSEAVKESLAFLGVGDSRITYPLHAAVFRAPLNEAMPCDTALFLVGRTGVFKSVLAALAQSFYGHFEYNSLPGNWQSTVNSLEYMLHRLKDVVVTIDEFVRRGEVHEEVQKKLERVVRSLANGSPRGRLSSDLSARPERPCRALVIVTGEGLPQGESINARLVSIRVVEGDIDAMRLGLRQARQSLLAYAMRGYIDWLRRRMTQIKKDIANQHRALREEAGRADHRRASSGMAHLLVGATYFAEFAKDVGVMTEAEATAHVENTREALLANQEEQAHATAQLNPALRFMEVLRGLYVRGAVTLRDVGCSLRPGGTDVGWRDGQFAYFETTTVLGIVNKAIAAMNEPQPLQAHGMWKALAEAGFIETSGKELTPKFQGDGANRVRVLKILLTTLVGPGDDPGGGSGWRRTPSLTMRRTRATTSRWCYRPSSCAGGPRWVAAGARRPAPWGEPPSCPRFAQKKVRSWAATLLPAFPIHIKDLASRRGR